MGQNATKLHEKRISRCLQSFQQLQADIRHLNVHVAAEFARPQTELELAVSESEKSPAPPESSASASTSTPAPPVPELLLLQFRPFTKLAKKSALPWLWRINDNVIITATVTPKSVADAAIAAASVSSANNQAPIPINPKFPSFSLTIREFYHIFLYMCDNLKSVATLREQILKIEQPEVWAKAQEDRRAAVLALMQQKAKQHTNAGDEEEKMPSFTPSSFSLPRQSSAPSDCSICLSSPDEEGSGQELVVLPCLHSFCQECISDWKTQSSTCPLCRKELSDDPSDKDDEWILTSPDLKQLKQQYQKQIQLPYEFVSDRPAFPPVDNRKGVKTAGDAFSLAVGEVLDVFAPAQRRRNTNSSSSTPAPAMPVAEAVTIQR